MRSVSCESSVSRLTPPAQGSPIPLDPDDARCTTTVLVVGAPAPCPRGQTCVLNDFGLPAADRPNSGTCRTLDAPAPKCTVTFCASTGSFGVCTVSGETATCSAWATRDDTSSETPNCRFPCPRDCPNNAISSDGRRFCNACVLRRASCEDDFRFSGPLTPREACAAPISIFLAPFCCTQLDIGCVPRGGICSTTGGLVPPVPCAKGLECVVTDFGFPAVDLPTSGICLPERDYDECAVDRCCRFGAKSICRVQQTDATCGAWASRTDGGPRPDCSFTCPRRCLPFKQRPLDSSGHRFCNFCVFCKQSCKNNFM